MQLSLVTAPADEPLTVEEARTHLRLSGTGEDGYIAALIAAARRQCEQKTGRCLVTQTWDVLYDSFAHADPRCRGEIWLPRSPVQGVTHVKYYDAAGVQQTWSSANYQLAQGTHPRLAPVAGVFWPGTYERLQAVEIRLVCGYGDPAAVPEDLLQWMLVMIGHWYEHREAASAKTMSALPFIDGLLDRESIVVVG
jgi:uncharacterized phiE125 gp8 family phage protein